MRAAARGERDLLHARRRGPLSAVADFLVEPIDPPAGAGGLVDRGWSGIARPAVAVAGLAARCGTTTVARALAAELALRDAGGAAIVSAEAIAGGGIPLGAPAAGRLGRAVQRAIPSQTRAVGRICLAAADSDDVSLVEVARDLAPLVLDVTDSQQAAAAASLVDAVVLVGAPSVEPALAAVLAESLGRVGPEPLVVLNRDRGDEGPWDGRCALRLPEGRMGGQLALAGREARGELGRAVAKLADLVAVTR
ncbi:MAG TPA: hypothetical protein VHF90_03295 [Thermoleophilaceae bacterium]|nr:hypothetical protein [Thermoleophilaceae bacterium]